MTDKEKSIASKLLDIIEAATDESRRINIDNYVQFLRAIEIRQNFNFE